MGMSNKFQIVFPGFYLQEKVMKKDYKKVIKMYLGNIATGKCKQSFKPYALLYTICIKEVSFYSNAYNIEDLRRLMEFVRKLPKQKHATLLKCINFFAHRVKRFSKCHKRN
jgi:hypothetical protein